MASHSGGDDFEITGINVTPLVDIMLVLLIIFMVTATYIVKEVIKIELPRAAATSETTARTLRLVITKEGGVYLDGAAITEAALARKIDESPDKKEDMQAVISADRAVMHGSVVHVLDLLKTRGINKFAIEIDAEKGP